MFTRNVIISILIVFFSQLTITEIVAQNEVNLALRSEIGVKQISVGEINKSDYYIIPIQNLFLTFDIDLYGNISLQFRPGFILSKNYYEGFELGGYLNYKIPNSKLYSQLGINYHFNSSVDGNSGGSGETISLIGFGIGYQISKKISMDVSYHHPIQKFYGSFGYPEQNLHKSYYIERIIEMGIGFRIN